MSPIHVPWIRKEEIYVRAESLLDEHGLGDAPVEADFIIDEIFGIEIVVAEDLYRTTSVYAFLSGGPTQVFVDYETSVGDPAWYNFSLAHKRLNANEPTIAYRMKDLGMYRKYL